MGGHGKQEIHEIYAGKCYIYNIYNEIPVQFCCCLFLYLCISANIIAFQAQMETQWSVLGGDGRYKTSEGKTLSGNVR